MSKSKHISLIKVFPEFNVCCFSIFVTICQKDERMPQTLGIVCVIHYHLLENYASLFFFLIQGNKKSYKTYATHVIRNHTRTHPMICREMLWSGPSNLVDGINNICTLWKDKNESRWEHFIRLLFVMVYFFFTWLN